jgi:hypothetical protein
LFFKDSWRIFDTVQRGREGGRGGREYTGEKEECSIQGTRENEGGSTRERKREEIDSERQGKKDRKRQM